MRRFVATHNVLDLPERQFDVLIAGGGLSGLYVAALLPETCKIGILVKTTLLQSNSMLAQGGIAAAVGNNDSPRQHFYDSMGAGSGISDPEALRLMVEQGPKEILQLASMGVPFETDKHGHWIAGCEGAHSRPRILRCGGDATGRIMMETLIGQVKKRPNITMIEQCYLTDIVADMHQQAAGVIAFYAGSFQFFKANRIVIATGGIGGIYRISTNEPSLVGDGIAAAIRASVRLQNMEFVQFHPTAFFVSKSNGSHFLISETVRGEGAILRNAKGLAFMENRHALKDLAPRDVVAREIFREMTAEGSDHVFLDITHRPVEFLKQRFPNIYKHCSELGFFMESDLLPVAPAQHYFMGGIATDVWGRTSMPGLYACGETACTGVHGANRLAGNSLLECVVFSARVATDIQNTFPTLGKLEPVIVERLNSTLQDPKNMGDRIKWLMQAHGGIIKNNESLIFAINELGSICEIAEKARLESPEDFQLLNMATVAREILLSAMARPEDLGAHWFVEEKHESDYFGW